MPVVERILFVVSGVALLAGAFALFSYERTLATRTPGFELSAAHSTTVSLPDAGGCAGKAASPHLLSPLPAAHWREGRCTDQR